MSPIKHSSDHNEPQLGSQSPPPPPPPPPPSFDDQPDIPLLLRKSYARSKSSMHDELRGFRMALRWCALDHSTPLGKSISYLTFAALAVLVPALTSLSVKLPAAPSDDPLPELANRLVHLPESGLSLIAFLTLRRFFRRYGLRHLLFLDALNDDSLDVQRGYRGELDKALRRLAFISLPSLLVELAHKLIFFSNVTVDVPFVDSNDLPSFLPLSSIILFLSGLVSWVYRTGVFLLVCVLFRLTCELQILRLGGLRRRLEGVGVGFGSEPRDVFEEHGRIREQLYVTSHRFRFFIVGCTVIITVSQFVSLLLVLASKSEKNFFNSGDLVVCSGVQVSGFLLCLMGAARITHRAQGIVSVATRWHMQAMIAGGRSSDAAVGSSNRRIKDGVTPTRDSRGGDEGGGSAEASPGDDVAVAILQESHDFQTRQTLVTYLEHNNGGITLFGYALDRGMLHTLFAFEFSLLLWILSKVIVLS